MKRPVELLKSILDGPSLLMVGRSDGIRLDCVAVVLDVEVTPNAPGVSESAKVVIRMKHSAMLALSEAIDGSEDMRKNGDLCLALASVAEAGAGMMFCGCTIHSAGDLESVGEDGREDVYSITLNAEMVQMIADSAMATRPICACIVKAVGGPLDGSYEIVKYPAPETCYLRQAEEEGGAMFRYTRVVRSGVFVYSYK